VNIEAIICNILQHTLHIIRDNFEDDWNGNEENIISEYHCEFLKWLYSSRIILHAAKCVCHAFIVRQIGCTHIPWH